MLEQLIVSNAWLALAIWVVLYISEYYLTIIGARLYQADRMEHFVFEQGYELNPFFQKDIAALRLFSPRFLFTLALTSSMIMIMHAVTRSSPYVFSFLMGACILASVTLQIRHVRSIAAFIYARQAQALRGRIEYSRRFNLMTACVELGGFATLYLIEFLVSGSWFFIGGTTACLSLALRFWILSLKQSPTPPPANPIPNAKPGFRS